MTLQTVTEWMTTPPTPAFVIEIAVTELPDGPGPHLIYFESSHGAFTGFEVRGAGVYRQIVNRERFTGISRVRARCVAGVRGSIAISSFTLP